MFKMLIGITFLTVISDIVLNNSDYKKYVKSIIGIFIILIIVQGFLEIKDINIDYSVIDKIEDEVKENTLILKDDVIDEMLVNMKREITLRLKEENIILKELEINIDETLNIINIVLRLENSKFNDKAIDIISEEFHIDKNVIEAG